MRVAPVSECAAKMVAAIWPLIPNRVALGHEHSRVADGEDVNRVIHRFVHDPVGLADDLPETVGVLRDGIETLGRNL